MSLAARMLLGALVLITLAYVSWYSLPASAESPDKLGVITIHWLIAHEPSDLFAKGAEEFARVLAEESGGEMELKLLTPKDMDVDLVGVGDIAPKTVFEMLDKGDIEMSTVLATGLAEQVPEILEVKLPFLFKDADDAFATLYSNRGGRLLARISEKTDTRALAFTLSGGFRVFVGQNPISLDAEEGFRGSRVITTAGEMGERTLRAFNANPLPVPNDINAVPDPEDLGAIEAAYTRLSAIKNLSFVRYVAETNHSLFFTTVLVSDSFYDSLSPKNQAALVKAARAAGEIEWADSIALGKKTKQELKSKGVEIEEISPQLRDALREKAQPVYDWFYGTYESLLST